MRSFHSIALLVLPLISTVVCKDAASPTKELFANHIYSNANEAFQDLLNALPEESLHVALNTLTKFKDGVFESGRHGVEHVHHDNPPLATRLIVAAVQDLKKRQLPAPTNGTVAPTQTSQEPSQESTPSPSQQSQDSSSANPSPAASSKPADPAAVVPVQLTTTNSNGQATVISSSLLSKATAFVPVDVTRTNAQGSTVVSQVNKPAVIFTATDSAGSAFVTTSAVNFAPTSGEVLTTTDAKGSTFLTTYTPDGGRVSSIVLVTTTGSNGQPMVITSYTFVDPAAATENEGQAPATGTSTATPGLQTNAARKNIVREMALVGGAVGGVFVLFV